MQYYVCVAVFTMSWVGLKCVIVVFPDHSDMAILYIVFFMYLGSVHVITTVEWYMLDKLANPLKLGFVSTFVK